MDGPALAEVGQPRGIGRELADPAAGTRSLAAENLYKEPWGPKSYGLAELTLPCAVVVFLLFDHVAHLNNLVGELAV